MIEGAVMLLTGQHISTQVTKSWVTIPLALQVGSNKQKVDDNLQKRVIVVVVQLYLKATFSFYFILYSFVHQAICFCLNLRIYILQLDLPRLGKRELGKSCLKMNYDFVLIRKSHLKESFKVWTDFSNGDNSVQLFLLLFRPFKIH